MPKKTKKRIPRNTAREAQIAPLRTILEQATQGSASFIMQQEAEGKESFVNSDTLPTDMTPETKNALIAVGVKFGGVVEGDPLFQYATLPKGWKRVGDDDHSMWSKLVDDKGKDRAVIFYKAAYYDREAFLRLV